ncbi:MAG TPA: isocitrate lyase/phosphoenolpyruvate mutase family protein [Actinomycetota bacterium]|nr:isocitrate lyase/phosphoenolpyruvate mutase family protein [Actinomycetota bacterium]
MATAETLRALHVPGDPVILPNVWDGTSARVVAEAGFPAIATSSVAMADSLGYADGEETPPDEMFAAVGRVARLVDVPLTADIERGYRSPPDEIVRRLVAAGAVGCNLEDSDPATKELIDVDTQAAFLRDVVAAGDGEIVVNARIDVFIRATGAESSRLDEAISRARAYLDAGVDCVYPIGLMDAEGIERFVAEVDGPANITLRPGAPSLQELAKLGVARVSLGGGLHIAMRAWLDGQVARVAAGSDPSDFLHLDG